VVGGACIDNLCKMPGDNGTACGGNLDCASGNCVDMMCCDTACNTTCMSCRSAEKDSGPNGICGPAKVGLACGATSCASGVQTGPQCTATQTCETANAACAPYLCQDTEKCAITCTTDSQCKPGNFCKTATSECKPKGALGLQCAENKECLSGKCVDWVCCDTACGGSDGVDCQACSAAKGATQDGVCTLLTNTVCNQGGINGVCSGGVCIEGQVDAGADAPKDAPGDTLPPETSTDAQQDTATPEGGKDAAAPEGSAGSPSDASGETSDDGAAGGTQGGPPPAAGDSGGCGCRTPASSSSPSAWLVLFGAAAVAASRRRRN